MGISLDHIVERPATRGRHVDMIGYTSAHGLRILAYRGVEEIKGRNISIWDAQCPHCAKIFPIRQNAIDVYKSCGCRCRVEYRTTEEKDLRGYHKQLMTQPERLCERWHDGDVFIADLADFWVTGHILCRPNVLEPLSPTNWASCPADGGTRKCRVINIGTIDHPEFISSNKALKLLQVSRTRLHAQTDEHLRRKLRSLLNRPPEPEDQPHPHPHQTASTSP